MTFLRDLLTFTTIGAAAFGLAYAILSNLQEPSMREIIHHNLDLAKVTGLSRVDAVEVWADAPDKDQATHIVLYQGFEHSIDLLPSEARALAALLIVAAETQERRINGQ